MTHHHSAQKWKSSAIENVFWYAFFTRRLLRGWLHSNFFFQKHWFFSISGIHSVLISQSALFHIFRALWIIYVHHYLPKLWVSKCTLKIKFVTRKSCYHCRTNLLNDTELSAMCIKEAIIYSNTVSIHNEKFGTNHHRVPEKLHRRGRFVQGGR